MTRLGCRIGIVMLLTTLGALGLDTWLNEARAAGSILVLAVTALAVLWYADTARRQAEIQARPDVIIRRPDHPQPPTGSADILTQEWRRRVRTRIINEGNGPAFDVYLNDGDESHRIADCLAKGDIAYDDRLYPLPRDATSYILSYKDIFGNSHSSGYIYKPALQTWIRAPRSHARS